ncbi:hypothetical protein GOODEAATRI_008596 [Goodea atripinnis]|uniref:Uncharacterized protein n=1 Tax=Goodea atripinnis TaxID=208336 RepID=A0ABV0MZW7_9TELE
MGLTASAALRQFYCFNFLEASVSSCVSSLRRAAFTNNFNSYPGSGVRALPWISNANSDLIASSSSSSSHCSAPIGPNGGWSSACRDSDQLAHQELVEAGSITAAPHRDLSFKLSVVLHKVVTGFSHGNPRLLAA